MINHQLLDQRWELRESILQFLTTFITDGDDDDGGTSDGGNGDGRNAGASARVDVGGGAYEGGGGGGGRTSAINSSSADSLVDASGAALLRTPSLLKTAWECR